jgi:hypothetical protein
LFDEMVMKSKLDRFGGVMVSVVASCVEYSGFDPQSMKLAFAVSPLSTKHLKVHDRKQNKAS